MRRSAILFALFSSILFQAKCRSSAEDPNAAGRGAWQVLALEYGRSDSFRLSTMISGAPEDKRVEASWMAWLIRPRNGAGRRILVDTGFDDENLARQWKLKWRERVPAILNDLGEKPSSVTDVVITHLHWDHVGDVEQYTNARFWLQKREFERALALVSEERPIRAGVRLEDIRRLKQIQGQGRLTLIDGEREIAPGVSLVRGGSHTAAIQWVKIETGISSVRGLVLASDNAYLFQNVEQLKASGSTSNPQGDVSELRKMIEAANDPKRVIPSHDPLVAQRFRELKKHVFELK